MERMMKRTKKALFLIFCILSLFLCSALPAFADTLQLYDSPGGSRLVDNAGLLSSEDAAEISAKLDEISERLGFDVVIATTNSLEGKSLVDYADDFYDYSGYRDDGAILLIDMSERQYRISTRGYGIDALTDAGLSYMENNFRSHLSSGDYKGAFLSFANDCDDLVTNAHNGNVYDIGNEYDAGPASKTPGTLWGIGAVILGFIASFTGAKREKAKLKTVRYKANASDYVRRDSFRLTRSNDIFLYRNVTRTRRAQERQSGGGSTVHTSSSGHMHGGTSGKF